MLNIRFHGAKERYQTTMVYEPGSFVPMLRIEQASDSAAKRISAYVTEVRGTPMQLVTPGATLCGDNFSDEH